MRKGEELKAPRYASAAATRDYITTRDIIPNNNIISLYTYRDAVLDKIALNKYTIVSNKLSKALFD